MNNQPSNSDNNKVQSRQQSDQQQIATSLPPQEEINNVVAISEQAPVTDPQQISIDMLLQPNLLNQNLLLLKQKSTPDHEFTHIIKRLPQNLKQLTDAANKAFKTAQFETLKSTLHQLATSADQVGLEQLSEMALALEFRQSQEVTATDFTQLAKLCDASINKIQSSDLLN
jgi:Hpt domain